MVATDDLGEVVEYPSEPLVDGLGGLCRDAAIGAGTTKGAACLDHTPPRVRKTWVYAKYYHYAALPCITKQNVRSMVAQQGAVAWLVLGKWVGPRPSMRILEPIRGTALTGIARVTKALRPEPAAV